ncbi:MAG: dihydroorotase family protein, partial [Nitrospinota bacterium]
RECFESLGITSFKFYLTYRGPDAELMGISGIDDGFLYECMSEVASLSGGLLCLHAENIEIIQRLRQKLIASGRADLRAYSESRPPFTEAEAIGRAISLAEAARCPILIHHLSSRKGLEEVRGGRRRFPFIYLETTPTFLTHTEDSELGAAGKVKPPLRKREDLEALWKGLKGGTIDTVGSDHVPRKRALKEADLWNPVTGVPGAATLLPVLLSEGAHRRGMSLEQVARATSFNPARLYGLYPRKGCLAPGSEADLTVVDMELEKEVRAEELFSHADYSLYEGWRLRGWPVLTMVRGRVVMRDGKVTGQAGSGRYVPRSQGLSPL